MPNVRIIELETADQLVDNDYLAIDSASVGTRKMPLQTLLDRNVSLASYNNGSGAVTLQINDMSTGSKIDLAWSSSEDGVVTLSIKGT